MPSFSMTPPDITGSEWTVMEALWKASPQTALEVSKEVREETGWAVNTVRTLLARLLEKGVVKSRKNSSGVAAFEPLLEREVFVKRESESFLKRVFQGAANSLVLHFVRSGKLTPKEVEALKHEFDQAKVKRK
jgi:BlaI family penicillinase repressor